jgi:predicted  nucleic acid-binding Zn-ribbon protein
MWDDVVRLRKWKGSVDEENARLKAERVQLKLEVTRLQEETTRLREERAASQTEVLRLRDEAKALKEGVIRAREKEASQGPAAAIRHAVQRSEEENVNVRLNVQGRADRR